MAFVARPTGVLVLRANALRACSIRSGATSRFLGSRVDYRTSTPRSRFLATARSPPPPRITPTDSTSETVSAPAQAATEVPGAADDALRLLWDSDCPLCVKEVNFLRRRMEKYEQEPVIFVDIAEDTYTPEENAGIDYATAMGRIHAVKANGEVLVGIDAFAAVYERIGLGWVYAATKLPVVGAVADWAYDFWADRRLTWTGRPALEEILAAREKRTCR